LPSFFKEIEVVFTSKQGIDLGKSLVLNDNLDVDVFYAATKMI
jgi:hypothetical protein